jgi:hypothetical protein
MTVKTKTTKGHLTCSMHPEYQSENITQTNEARSSKTPAHSNTDKTYKTAHRLVSSLEKARFALTNKPDELNYMHVS